MSRDAEGDAPPQEVRKAWEQAHAVFCPRASHGRDVCSTHLRPGDRWMLTHSAETEVTETRVEWRVESETLEDEFGTDEAAAREWLAQCQANPAWEPAELMSRVVTVTATPWTRVTSPTGP